jgi:hypothetical protein
LLYPFPVPGLPTLTVAGGSFVVDFAAALLVAPVAGAAVGAVVPVELVGALVGAPPPTVTTRTAEPLGLEELPDRPMRTPTPIASRSTPMPAISVLLGDIRERGDLGGGVGDPAPAEPPATAGKRCSPRRSPHSTQ